MPFFLKPCLKFRKKKNKKKSKSEETMKRVCDVTAPITTDEIWQGCKLDLSSSNLSENTVLTSDPISDINRNRGSARTSNLEIDEVSANESLSNLNDIVCSQNVSLSVSHENIRINSDEEFGNDFLENENKRETPTDSVTKRSMDSLHTVSDKQVDDPDKMEEGIPRPDMEKSGVSLNEEVINEPNIFNNINVNTNVLKKIEELRYIESSLKQGDQSSIENIDEENDENISQEINGIGNNDKDYLIKSKNSHETNLNKLCPNFEKSRSNFKSGSYRDNIDYEVNKKQNNHILFPMGDMNDDNLSIQCNEKFRRLDDEAYANETSGEYANYESNASTPSLKQSEINMQDKWNCKENSFNSLVNNSIESNEGVIEISEIDTQKVDDECLNARDNLEINDSIENGIQESDSSEHNTLYVNSPQNSPKNEKTSARDEMCNLKTTNNLANVISSKTLSLDEMETIEFEAKVVTKQSKSCSNAQILLISDVSTSPKKYHSGCSLSEETNQNDTNEEDCSGDEMEFFSGKTGSTFNSNNHVEENENKSKDIEIHFSDSKKCELTNEHTGAIREVGENDINGKVDFPNNFKASHENQGMERTNVVRDGDEFTLNCNEYSHLTLHENERFSQINANKFPLNLEDVNSTDDNEIFLCRKNSLSYLEEGSNIRMKSNCAFLENLECQEEELFPLIKDFDGHKAIENCCGIVNSEKEDRNYFLSNIQNTICGLHTNTKISHHIDSCCDKEKHNTSGNDLEKGYKTYENLYTSKNISSIKWDNSDSSIEDIDNNYCIECNKDEEYKMTLEENAIFKPKNIPEILCTDSHVDTGSLNKIINSTSFETLKEKENFCIQNSTSLSQNFDFLYPGANCSQKSSKTFKLDNNPHCNKKLHPVESVEKRYDYEEHELCENKSSEFHVVEGFNGENNKFDELENDRNFKEYESCNLNDIYEKCYAFQNTQSPKRLNRFSNISSTSESSISSMFSDESYSKSTPVSKKESKSFSISACGDRGNNENIDGTTDNFKSLEKDTDAYGIKEPRMRDETNENHATKREKLTISITRKPKKEAIKTQNLTKNQSGNAFINGFKSMDPTEFQRLKESIEIFNKKIQLALSDMKPNIRQIPIKKAETIKMSSNIQKKTCTPFLKFSLNSSHTEIKRNLKELMPETLLKKNKNDGKDQVLNHNKNVGESFDKTYIDIVSSSESESESSQTSDKISPITKRILEASRQMRSPKYPFRCFQKMSLGNSHFKMKPVIIKSPKGNLVAYLTKDDKNVYQIKRGYRLYKQDSGNFQVNSSEQSQSYLKKDYAENALNSRTSSPDYLKLTFDNIFKRYARQGGSNGQLISYKRSTEWLRDAGIIGKSLTAKEANDAFKCTAGVKIALNKEDYRHYLKKIARIKRLNYNEIYKRLCSPNRFIESRSLWERK